jgi:magnesium-transporting ATPase (P-type)
VHYIFSDKTGTLTCNIMEFKKFSVGPLSYGMDGHSLKHHMAKRRPTFEKENISNVNFEDPVFFQHLKDSTHSNNKPIMNYLECLALCHTVIIEKKDQKEFYGASSPDELALVNAAKYFGVTFVGRDDDSNMILDYGNGRRDLFQLLNVLEFNSTRKRMSIIVKNREGQIKLICKGADSIIKARLDPNTANMQLFESTD